MTRFIRIDNVRRQMTAEEESAKDSDEEQMTIDKQTEADANATLEANKTSGKAKLKAGETLTDAEVSALFGD